MDDIKNQKTLASSITWLLNNPFMSDVQFEFGMTTSVNGNGIQSKVIYAHSLILCTRSQLFANQFTEDHFNKAVITVTDIKYATFFEFLSFLYTDKCKLINENVDEILELAQQHLITRLEENCLSFMMKNSLSVRKVLKILANDITDELSEDFKYFARRNTKAILDDPQFPDINRNALEIILHLNKLDISEMEIFDAAIKWAERACQKLRIEMTSKNKRTILGDAIKLIRFPIMTALQFSQCIAKENELLTTEEIGAILLEITSEVKNKMGFNSKNRRTNPLPHIEQITLENTVNGIPIANNRPTNNQINESMQSKQINLGSITGKLKHGYSPFRATFKVNKRIVLNGLQISYSVIKQTCRIQVIDDNEIFMYDGNFPTLSNYTTNCYFDSSNIILIPNIFYTIKITFLYPSEFSFNDEKKMPHIEHKNDVQFHFTSLNPIINRIYYLIN